MNLINVNTCKILNAKFVNVNTAKFVIINNNNALNLIKFTRLIIEIGKMIFLHRR